MTNPSAGTSPQGCAEPRNADAAPRERDGVSRKAEVTTARRSYRKSGRKAISPPTEASVYLGLIRVGDLIPSAGDRWTAVDPSGLVVGVFASRREAARAVAEVGR